MPDIPNLRTMTVSTGSGKDVTETSMLKGEAKDSLSGTNNTGKNYTSDKIEKGKLGGLNTNS